MYDSLRNFSWTPFFFALFTMHVQKVFPCLIQFNKINTSCKELIIEMQKHTPIKIQTEAVFSNMTGTKTIETKQNKV